MGAVMDSMGNPIWVRNIRGVEYQGVYTHGHVSVVRVEDGVVAAALVPDQWRPTPLAVANLCDALIATVEPVDHASVPVGEVFSLVSRIAGDLIRELATAKAQATQHQLTALEQQGKVAKLAALQDLTLEVLVKAAIGLLGQARANSPTGASVVQCGECLSAEANAVADRLSSQGRVAPPTGPIANTIQKVVMSWVK